MTGLALLRAVEVCVGGGWWGGAAGVRLCVGVA